MKKLFALLLAVLVLTGCATTYDGPTEGKYVLTEETRTYYAFGRVQFVDRTAYAYDIHGNLVQIRDYQDDELEDATYFRYDDRGNRISTRSWDHSGLIPLPRSSQKSTYDDRNRMLTTIHRDGWGRKTGTYTYTYDDESNSYICESDSGTQSTYYLDENGQTLRFISDSGYEYLYERDAWGHVIRSQVYENGAFHSSYEARYDDQGRLLWEGHYDGAGNLERETSIEYDDEAHTSTTPLSWGVQYSYYAPDGRILRTEKYEHDGTLSDVIEYTYQLIQVSAKEGTP